MTKLSLESFRGSVLKAWAGDTSAAFAAASEAMWLAVRTEKGTVVVSVFDMAAQRTVLAFLAAFTTDQEHLSQLHAKALPDGTLLGKVRILVLPKDTSRRPRGVVSTVTMPSPAEVQKEKEPLPDDRELARRLASLFDHIALRGSEPNAAEMKLLNMWGEKLGCSGMEVLAAWKRGMEANRAKFRVPNYMRLKPTVVHAGSAMEAFIDADFEDLERTRIEPQTREERIVSHAYEVQRGADAGKAEIAQQRERSNLPALTGPRPRRSR
jgi:hypothetical protein